MNRTPILNLRFCLAILSIIGLSTPAQANVIINVTELGGDVLLEGSGSFDLSALTLDYTSSGARAPFIHARHESGVLRIGSFYGLAPIDGYIGVTGGGPFGTEGPTSGGVGTGDLFGASSSFEIDSSGSLPVVIWHTAIDVPAGYISGSPLSAAAAFPGQTFETLGITPGTYVWAWGSGPNADSLTVNIVPEPTTAMMIGLCLIGQVFRQQKSSPNARRVSAALPR